MCLIGIDALKSPNSVLFAGTGMCLNMWGTAAWLLVRSDQIAARSVQDSSTALTA